MHLTRSTSEEPPGGYQAKNRQPQVANKVLDLESLHLLRDEPEEDGKELHDLIR